MVYNTTKPDVVMSVKDLNKRVGKTAYILILDDLIIVAGLEVDMNKYLKWEDGLLTPEHGLEDLAYALYGFVLNPAEMPYDLPASFMNDRAVYVIESDERGLVSVEECLDTAEAAHRIEEAIKADDNLAIEDFAVVVAEEVDIAYTIGSDQGYVSESDVYG